MLRAFCLKSRAERKRKRERERRWHANFVTFVAALFTMKFLSYELRYCLVFRGGNLYCVSVTVTTSVLMGWIDVLSRACKQRLDMVDF